ncbi:hypothetical protein PLANPX_4131 [Lacipirellula parvula]|uniref:Uncharacterized protein n=1 Tax=Lacipirellula parvula TaxID=2650471 RepID=A0A5K7XN46_9BACT|nr:hypothetical protein PLANPX_4131 [Lacipirellula parvula]
MRGGTETESAQGVGLTTVPSHWLELQRRLLCRHRNRSAMSLSGCVPFEMPSWAPFG